MNVIIDATAGYQDRVFAAGDTIVQQGGEADDLFVLVDGELDVYRDATRVATFTQPGSVVGEMSALLGTRYSATVVAKTDSTVRVLPSGGELLLNDQVVLSEVARLLARRLHLITTYLVDLRQQYGDSAPGLSMVDDVLAELMTHQGDAIEGGSEREADPNL